MELEGTPDMTLEIVSKTSEREDTEMLPDLYGRAGVREYWLVDVRGKTPVVDVFRHGPTGYVPAPNQDGWVFSEIFDREFRLVVQTDPLGHPQYILDVRERKVSRWLDRVSTAPALAHRSTRLHE